MKTRILPITLILILLAFVLIASDPAQSQGTAALSPHAAELQAALENPSLDAQTRASLEEKLEMEQRIQNEKNAAKAKPAEKQPGTPPDFGKQDSTEAPPSGIFEGGEAIIHGWEAQIANHWQDAPDGQLTQVYAGALADDPEQGVLFVVRWVEGVPQITRHLTPTRDGAVRILSVEEGLLLRVETSGGSAWLFDWRTGEFK